MNEYSLYWGIPFSVSIRIYIRYVVLSPNKTLYCKSEQMKESMPIEPISSMNKTKITLLKKRVFLNLFLQINNPITFCPLRWRSFMSTQVQYISMNANKSWDVFGLNQNYSACNGNNSHHFSLYFGRIDFHHHHMKFVYRLIDYFGFLHHHHSHAFLLSLISCFTTKIITASCFWFAQNSARSTLKLTPFEICLCAS